LAFGKFDHLQTTPLLFGTYLHNPPQGWGLALDRSSEAVWLGKAAEFGPRQAKAEVVCLNGGRRIPFDT
jgi:hypothetical protein